MVKQLLKHLTILQGLNIGHFNTKILIDYNDTVLSGHYAFIHYTSFHPHTTSTFHCTNRVVVYHVCLSGHSPCYHMITITFYHPIIITSLAMMVSQTIITHCMAYTSARIDS